MSDGHLARECVPCILSITIQLLPTLISATKLRLSDMLDVVNIGLSNLVDEYQIYYFKSFSLSHAVDGNQGTSFRSLNNANENKYLPLDMFGTTSAWS
ncbi:hypothetical protein BDQ17DRAFT_1341459 [Cyathus striatus]|nr:hypothetical protein BDQ17DRAFT_1341459 [Cyathus striatus]